jgi:hypothetical protein
MYPPMALIIATLDRSVANILIGGVDFLNWLLDTVDLELDGSAVRWRNSETIGCGWRLVHRLNSFGTYGF